MTVTPMSDLTEIIQTEVIDSLIIHYQFDEVNFLPFARFKDMRNETSNVASFPRWVKDAHADIANESTALTPELLETTAVDLTMARVGLAREPSESALETTILGRARLIDEIVMDSARLLGEAAEEDFAAKFADASNSVTDSGNDLEIVDLV